MKMGSQAVLLNEYIAHNGQSFFRWRSYVLLIFAPLIVWAMMHGEPLDGLATETPEYVYNAACLGLIVLGQLVRALTIGFVPNGTSGRNVTSQLAVKLNTTGLYSLTRNPLYLGNCLSILGILLYVQDPWLALVAVLFLTLYYGAIIMAEESFLAGRFGADYRQWASRTNAFLPSLRRWTPPDLPFSWRFTLRREHSSCCSLPTASSSMDWAMILMPASGLRTSWATAEAISARVESRFIFSISLLA